MNNASTQVPNHLVWAILVSIIQAAKVNGLVAAGDIAGAQAASASAKKWAIISAGVAIGLTVLYILFFVVVGGMGAMSSSY